MNPRETVYQNGDSPDSLSAALQMWLKMIAANPAVRPRQLGFTFSCTGESRARRVAGYLRRRLQCASTSVRRIEGGNRDEWYIDGATRPEMPSLPDLERLCAWLGGAAARHQVLLREITIR